MPILTATNLDYLIDSLRMKIGDTNPASYQYADEWLRTALVQAVKDLQRWWNHKYLIDTSYNVYRNTAVSSLFLFPEPPIVQNSDEAPIILMAALETLEGTLQNSAWTTGSWKDAEISYSNIESSRMRTDLLRKLWDELTSILKVPQKRLAQALKGSLPGYKDSTWEGRDKY